MEKYLAFLKLNERPDGGPYFDAIYLEELKEGVDYVDDDIGYTLIEKYPLDKKLEFMDKYWVNPCRNAPSSYKHYACIYTFSDRKDSGCIACLCGRYNDRCINCTRCVGLDYCINCTDLETKDFDNRLCYYVNNKYVGYDGWVKALREIYPLMKPYYLEHDC